MGDPGRARLTCEDVIGMLVDYLEAALTPDTVTALERHLEICPPCVAYLNTYRKTRELAGTAGRVEMPEEMKRVLRDQLLARLDKRADRSR
jgi:anti-sigma factor RsiW